MTTYISQWATVGQLEKQIMLIVSFIALIGWGVGDPHINTMDGANYTFNGWGEYTLFTARGFSLQGRTMPVNLTMSDSATQWSAFAFGSHGNTFVEVSDLLF